MPHDDERKTHLVECFWPGVDESKFASAVVRAQAAAAQLRGEGIEIEFLGSILLYADETVFCFFAGCEADVRAASEWAGLPFERVLEARIDKAGQSSAIARR
jgi:hypothetical protein